MTIGRQPRRELHRRRERALDDVSVGDSLPDGESGERRAELGGVVANAFVHLGDAPQGSVDRVELSVCIVGVVGKA